MKRDILGCPVKESDFDIWVRHLKTISYCFDNKMPLDLQVFNKGIDIKLYPKVEESK